MESSYLLITSIVTLIISAFLGLIPANIAKNKGYSFGLWWFYGWMLFIIAFIHSTIIPDKNAQHNNVNQVNFSPSVTDELIKYKELFDMGVITEDEFKAKKEQLIFLIRIYIMKYRISLRNKVRMLKNSLTAKFYN